MANVNPSDLSSAFFSPQIYQNAAKQSERNKKKASAVSKKSFLETFENVRAEESSGNREALLDIASLTKEEALQTLLSDIQDKSSILSGGITPDHVKSYRQSVRNFLNFVVKNSYDVEEHISVQRKGVQKKKIQREVIRVIDEKLDRLAADILSEQSKNLSILEKLNEINGLILDLLS